MSIRWTEIVSSELLPQGSDAVMTHFCNMPVVQSSEPPDAILITLVESSLAQLSLANDWMIVLI